jgi:hypothetical protein
MFRTLKKPQPTTTCIHLLSGSQNFSGSGEYPMKKEQVLKLKLKILEEQISEVKRRLPAHSTKPPLMGSLMDLEDEYDLILLQIDELKSQELEI